MNKGLYVYDGISDIDPLVPGTTQIDSQPASGIAECDGNIYFLRTVVTYGSDEYPSHNASYDAKLYRYDGSGVTAV